MASSADSIQRVHRVLFPTHGPTPLRPIPAIAKELGVKAVYVKDESSRYGLPAFKVLGASWAIASLLGDRWGVDPWDIDALKRKAATEPGLTIFTATDGNHGRAVARTAALLGIKAHIFVPSTVEHWSVDAIGSEGCPVTPVDADYDGAVKAASDAADALGKDGMLVQDMSWEGYEDAPARITAGYMTIAAEVDAQAPEAPTALVVPVGVGSLAHAIVQWYGPGGVAASTQGAAPRRIVTAEPDAAPCLHTSLARGEATATPGTRFTIMPGLNCGTVSPLAWPDLKAAVRPEDAVVVTDPEAERAVVDLTASGVPAGPCGAATLAAARKVKFGPEDVVVFICTEGSQDR